MKNFKQKLTNLPDELFYQPRFFRVGGYNKNKGGEWDNKLPVDKWNNTANQSLYGNLNFTDDRQLAGFDICGHGKAPDYLVLDFDHVLDDDGNFVTGDAQKWYNLVAQSGTFIEKSVSGHGLHAIFKPRPDEFNKMASGSKATLHLSDSNDKDAPKIEIFFKPGGRYFLFTGDVYNCTPKTPVSADCSVVTVILDEIKKCQPSRASNSAPAADERATSSSDNQSRARDMLKFIPCTELDYNDWLAVGMILKTNGNSIDDWLDWSRADSARFDEETCRYKWDTFKENDGELTIATLCDMAKNYGYTPPAPVDDNIIKIKSKLQWARDSHGHPTHVKGTQKNLNLIFAEDPLINGLIGYDEFFEREVLLKQVDWKENSIDTEWTDNDDSHLYCYLRDTYTEIKGKDSIRDTVAVFSRRNSFHPVKKYLESLVWDGIPRAEEFFIKFLKVEDSPYSREVTRKWLLGAVARIYYPGCDFQFALTLQGNQGIGKGFSARMLGKKWHITLTDNLDDSHALDAIRSGWIVEIEELAAARKSEINAVKSFISRGIDTRRASFERRERNFKRHCVFIITVNDSQFLRDHTGNRRFKILKCNNKPKEIVKGLTPVYVDQVWAEIFHDYKLLFADGFNPALLMLSRESETLSEEIAETYLMDDGMKGEIENFLSTKILPPFIWEHLTKEERRRFIVNANIEIKLQELNQRIRAKFGKNKNAAQEQIDSVYEYISANLNTTVARIESNEQKKPGAVRDEQGDFYRLHGTEERQATCAAEIFNECFGNDKRKSMARINEILSTLEGWALDGKQRNNFAGCYGRQKKIYCR